jgi:flagellar biosynthesis/type III secretory pathway protein FliH
MSEEQAPAVSAAGKEHQTKAHVPSVPPGSEATREMREMAQRRRESEEKLQQHLQEASEHLQEAKRQVPGTDHLPETDEKPAE